MRLRLLAGLLTIVAAAAPVAAQRGGHGGGRHSSARGGRSGNSGHVRSSPRNGGTHAPHMRAPGAGRSSAPQASRSRAPRSSSPHATAPRSRAPRSSAGGRDSHGRIRRSAHAKDDFMRQTGHPHGWPGHVVDHKVALACGGADDPSNMQWQTTADAKAKDRVERRGCGSRR